MGTDSVFLAFSELRAVGTASDSACIPTDSSALSLFEHFDRREVAGELVWELQFLSCSGKYLYNGFV